MSERGEIEVVIPVERPPTRAESRDLVAIGFDEARRLAGSVGGRVLGLVSAARAASLAGDLAIKLRFAVLAPEQTWQRPTVITVDRAIGKEPTP